MVSIAIKKTSQHETADLNVTRALQSEVICFGYSTMNVLKKKVFITFYVLVNRTNN